MAEALVRIAIVDDHQLIVDGIKKLLEKQKRFRFVVEANQADQLMNYLKVVSVDVLIMDINMPGMNGLDLLKQLKIEFPDIKVLVLSVHEEKSIVSRAMRLGAAAYLLKRSDPEEICEAIDLVVEGKSYFSGELTLQEDPPDAAEMIGKDEQGALRIQLLTDREQEILKYIVDGNSNQKIAEELEISRRTVDTHRNNLMQKLDIHNTVDLIKFALKAGL
ncbi:MAG: response regulator transcription factor [Bacteroidetes bacterium]|nr:MAG: response regulator transcription factor [Bacteroidota bacterium]